MVRTVITIESREPLDGKSLGTTLVAAGAKALVDYTEFRFLPTAGGSFGIHHGSAVSWKVEQAE